ncbi:hypothetical protein [Saccharopolyspora hordei]|uniref:hypothetical protein n=1 Tax=Saccharopolyspora hordei TaxID=1838 RepID=UPI0015C96586|nr:hypothetical protein [Saccharopolyspora hordei]
MTVDLSAEHEQALRTPQWGPAPKAGGSGTDEGVATLVLHGPQWGPALMAGDGAQDFQVCWPAVSKIVASGSGW